MKIHITCLGVFLCITSLQAQQSIATEVVLFAISPFGEALGSCRVDRFLGIDERPLIDRRNRFNGLTGTDIPYGNYQVEISCEGSRGLTSVAGGVGSTVTISRRKEYIVISSHRFLGHFVPELRIGVQIPTGIRETMWVKLVGVYTMGVYVGDVDPVKSSAQIDGAQPGSYILLLIAPGKVICTNTIRLLSPTDLPIRHALTLDVRNDGACNIVRTEHVSK